VARTPEQDSPETTRVVTLVHGRHRWRFSCAPGDEHTLVAAAARVAMRGNTSLDLADAAILARRLDAWPGAEPRPTDTNA
jgi:hypothetical protein